KGEPSVSSTGMSPPAAASYCRGLTLDGGGFRLPSVKELLTLVDEDFQPQLEGDTVVEKPIDVNAFPGTPNGTFRAAFGSCVDFSDGSARACNSSDFLRVRCVK